MKLMIMNYKPYEYELLQEKLDELGKKGYKTNHLSYVSFFKKTNTPVFYHITFYHPDAESRNDMLVKKNLFIEKYEKQHAKCIYSKQNMYIFASNHPISAKPLQNDVVLMKTRMFYLLLGFISLALGSFYCYLLSSFNIDSFLSNGILFVYTGFMLLSITVFLTSYFHFIGFTQFNAYLHKKLKSLNKKSIAFKHKIMNILLIISVIFFIGGLLEDAINAQSFSIQDHPVITLNELGIEGESTLETQKRSSFVVNESYSSLETVDNTLLYTKEYHFKEESKAQKLFKKYQSQPSEFGCDSFKIQGDIIYGYYQNDLIAMIILNEKKVVTIIPTFIISQNQAQIISQFYTHN